MSETDRQALPPEASLKGERAADGLSDDAFLGGQLRILQPKRGYRAGIDAVFLAASVPARRGETVLELGAGVGVASLCLAKRAPDARLIGLELQEELVATAEENARRNGLNGNVTFIRGDLFDPPVEISRRSFDHVIVNPPYYDEGAAVASPDRSKHLSKIGGGSAVENWMAGALRRVKLGGRLTAIYPADKLDRLIGSLRAQTGRTEVFPLWPKRGADASRVIISATKGSAAPVRLMSGLILHHDDGRYTRDAELVLREGGACPFPAR